MNAGLRGDRAVVVETILAEAARAFRQGARGIEITLVDGVGIMAERYPGRERPLENTTVFGFSDEGGNHERIA